MPGRSAFSSRFSPGRLFAPAPALSASSPEQDQFDSLLLTLDRGSLTIQSGDAFSYTRADGEAADFTLSEGTLCIRQAEDQPTILTLPKQEYEDFSLTVGEGHLAGECALSLESLKLEVNRGEASLGSLTVQGTSEIRVSQGSAALEGDLGSSVTAESSMGHLNLSLAGARSKYNIDLSLTQGDIRLGEDVYQGLEYSDRFDNGADRSLTLTCSRGDLSADFAAG